MLKNNQQTYKIKDLHGEAIKGSNDEKELEKNCC